MTTTEEAEFNYDCYVFLNMLEGMSYEEAVDQAKVDILED